MKEILPTYDINQQTMLLLPIAHIDYATLVIEQYRQLYVKQTPLQIIKAGCLDGGAEFEGRKKAVTHLTGAIQKVSMPINPLLNIFAFPTHSPTVFHCSWIFYHHVKSILPSQNPKDTKKQSIILFKNGLQLPMNESHYTLNKQMQRTADCVVKFTQPFQEMVLYPYQRV